MSNPSRRKTPEGTPEGETRVAQILTEAAILFRDHGFAGASMSDLARRVGVSKPALYHHFASKEDLFVAVATREPMETARRMASIAEDPNLAAGERLRLVLDCAYDNIILSMAGQMMPTIAEVSAQFPQIARIFRDGFIAGQQDALLRILKDGMASGEFQSQDTAFMVELTFGPPIMLSITRAMYGHLPDTPPMDLENAKRRHLAALMRVLT